MLMSYQESSELSEPRVGSLDNPAMLVSAQLAPVFVAPLLIVLPVRGDQFDASPIAHHSSEPNPTPPQKVPVLRPNLFMKQTLVEGEGRPAVDQRQAVSLTHHS